MQIRDKISRTNEFMPSEISSSCRTAIIYRDDFAIRPREFRINVENNN